MTKKCIECGTQHYNSKGTGEISDRCYNCDFIVSSLELFVKSMNEWIPSTTGKCNRKLTILGHKIEKIK